MSRDPHPRSEVPEPPVRPALAIVPARGGSVGIPRKNARLMRGKPLIAYAIEAARRCRALDAVVVSTEDAELAEIARRFGAEVLERPAELAGPEVTLDAVVVHAVEALEAAGRRFDLVATIQATSPLLRPATIEAVLERCRAGDDTALTVADAPHLAWGVDAEGRLVPLYEERANRQALPHHYRETGGVVVCRREVLERGTRFGQRVSVVEVDRAEALDVDDYFDWWLVERSLQRRRICFRVVGNRETGLGHAHRALTLADRLIDHEVRFVVRTGHELAARLIGSRKHPVEIVPPDAEIDTLRAFAPDLIVNDVLDTEKPDMEALRETGAVLINYEDLGPGASLAHTVVNALYHSPVAASQVRLLQGAPYCVLRDEFHTARPIRVGPEVRDVLLLFGGTDPNDLSSRCLQWLDELPGDWRITIVVGPGHPQPEVLQRLGAAARHEVDVVIDTRIVSHYMARTDLAVTSAGRTVFELASLGVPMVVIPQNDRECLHRFAMGSDGVLLLPRASEIDRLEFQGAVHELISNADLRSKLNRSLLSVDVRSGVERNLALIEDALRDRAFR